MSKVALKGSSAEEAGEQVLDNTRLDEIRRSREASAKHAGGHKKGKGGKPGRKGNPGRKGTGRSAEIVISEATVEVPPAAPVAIATAPAPTASVHIPAKKNTEVITVEKKVNSFRDIPGKIFQGGTLSLKPIPPQIQAVVDRVMNDIPSGLPDRTKIRKDMKKSRTIFTIPVDRDGVAALPESITPSSWNMSLGAEKRLEERTAVCYLKDGTAQWLKPYFTLNRVDNTTKEPLPPIDLFGFCSTQGQTQYAYILQVNKDREVLITKWSIRLDNPQKAIRDRVDILMNERLPLHDKERTAAAMPVLLKGFAGILCELYNQLANPPAKPVAPAFITPS